MLAPVYLVAFSGHRPDGSQGRTDEALESTAPQLKLALEALLARTRDAGGELHFISGVAAGADVIACEVAISLGLPLHIILPKPEDRFMETFKHLEHWLPRATAILGHVRSSPRNTLRMGAVSQHSPDCYAEANYRMLDAADLLLTVSTGEDSKSIAGTQHLIEEAHRREMPCINIDPLDPVFPMSADESTLDDLVGATRQSLTVFHELSDHVSCGLDPSLPTHRQVANCLSQAANRSAKSFRLAIAIAISLHAVAGFLAAGAASYFYALNQDTSEHGEHQAHLVFALLAFVELLLVGTAFGLELRAKWANKQRTWLQCRFARELMRGIEVANHFQDPLFPGVSRHHEHWGRFAITCALLIRAEKGALDVKSDAAIIAAGDDYRTKRVVDQIGHFSEKARVAHRTYSICHKVSHFAGPAALVVVALAFVVKADSLFFGSSHVPSPLNYQLDPWSSALPLLFLPIFVPLIASLSSSFLAAFDFGRRAVRYEEMVTALKKAAGKLPVRDKDGGQADAAPALRNIQSTVHHTEQLLLHELVEWLAAQKSGFGH